MQCINRNSREYQTLKKQSGLSDFVLSAYVGDFLETHDRFPYLDELPEADSSKAISEDLSLKKDNTTKTENILQATNTNTVEEAVPVLNDRYRDKEIEVLEVGSKSKVYITTRPNTTQNQDEKINNNYENVNSFTFFNEIIDKLQTLYGINIIPITNAELSQDRWASITGTKGVKSFIYNGNIYINTDIATVDSPVHELLHLLFGSMKYQNRALYDQLVGQAEQFDSYNTISQNYPNRTKGDINEEVFVTELAKYLTGQNNAISNLDQSIQNEIIYNVNRTLDTVLMGENSVKCVENPYIMNLKTLARLVNSSTMISEKRGSLSDATLNRMMANTKSELMKNKELREECQ